MRQTFHIMVVLDGPKPPIWRRLLVSSSTTLQSLHVILRRSLNWEWAPTHGFVRSPIEAIDPADEGRLRLRDVLSSPGARLSYIHDLDEDAWSHTITLESIQSEDAAVQLPVCVDGGRATPRGGCLGPWHYAAWLQSMRDPSTSEARRNCRYAGDGYDPEHFDRTETNRRLRKPARVRPLP